MSGSNYGSGNYGSGLYSLDPYTTVASVAPLSFSGAAILTRAASLNSSLPIVVGGTADTEAFGPLWNDTDAPAAPWGDTSEGSDFWQDTETPTNPWGVNG